MNTTEICNCQNWQYVQIIFNYYLLLLCLPLVEKKKMQKVFLPQTSSEVAADASTYGPNRIR
jgi:hypothetical protein